MSETTSSLIRNTYHRGFAPIKKNSRRVLVLYTGGTIGMAPSPRGYVCKAGYLPKLLRSLPMFHDPEYDLSQENLSTSSSSSVNNVTKEDDSSFVMSEPLVTPLSEFDRRTVYFIKEYKPLLDSCNMVSTDWARVAKDILDYNDNFDAFVVLHGTDTMAYTASALSFMLENLSKTVVVTGSQIPLVRPRNDGVSNLLGSLSIASHFDIPEVLLFFGSKVLRGCRASKVDSSSLEGAFDSPNTSSLGNVGIGIDIKWNLVRHPPNMKLALKSDFCNEVSIVRIYPGHFTTLAQTIAPPLKGLILQTFGAGNGPDQDHYFLSTLKEACDRGLVVVNVTQCHRGSVEAHYATGTALTEAGVISGIDMTCEAALVKLGWLLANYPNNPKKVREMMMLNIRGELTQQSNTLDASEASNNQSGHHGGSDTSGKPDNSDNSGISLESSNFLDVVFNVLQDNNKIQKTNGGIAELNAMDNIQKALLPTLMCAAASQGLTEDLKNMIFSNTGGTGKVSSALCAKLGDYDKRTALHLASSEGHVETVKFLLSLVEESDEKIDSQYVNVSAIDRFGTTPLRNAIDGGHLECVKLLANAGAKLSGMKHSILAHRLNQLVMDNEVDVLKLYILYGKVNVNVWDYDRRSPLHIAAAEGREECVDLLLKCGANPEFKDRWGCNSIQEAEKNGHKNILALLEKKK